MAEKNTITLIYDLDKTLCTKKQKGEKYSDVKPIQPMIDQLNDFYDQGYEIIISTARNMVTQNNDVSKVVQNVGMVTMQWLKKHKVKYHGLQFGKSYGHLYIDDKSCLNDPEEIQRRVNAIVTNTEDQYLNEHMNLRKKVEELENLNLQLQKRIDSLEQEKLWDDYER